MKIIVSGNGQPSNITLAGMGKGQIIFDFDDDNQILKDIIFVDIHGCPKLRDTTKTKFRYRHGEVIRHIKSRQWIKNKVKVMYENRKVSDLIKELQGNNPATTENSFLKDCFYIANIIAAGYLHDIIDEKNLHCGDKYHDNFAGKLLMILKPHIEAGKSAFPKIGPLIIRLDEKKKLSGYDDFYESLRNELCPGVTKVEEQFLEIPSWDCLVEIFFAVNYDHPCLAKNSIITYKQTQAIICEAQNDFLKVFQRFGAYDWSPTLFNSSISNSDKRHALKTSYDESKQQEITSGNPPSYFPP